MAHITHEKVLKALDKYRTSRRKNSACVYVTRNAAGAVVPVCLVGHVLLDLGVDSTPLFRNNSDAIDRPALQDAVRLPYKTRRLLRSIQVSCDWGQGGGRRSTWGAAIRKHLPSGVS